MSQVPPIVHWHADGVALKVAHLVLAHGTQTQEQSCYNCPHGKELESISRKQQRAVSKNGN